MNETIGIIPRAFRRRGVWVACTLLLRAGLNFLGLAMLLPVLALVLDPAASRAAGYWHAPTKGWASPHNALSRWRSARLWWA